ncbi:MAG: hypothetical protein M3407_10505, partial [Acidobacteriota bacterium]|nr:hypothetical protein [Acidobacteriota bacterium]
RSAGLGGQQDIRVIKDSDSHEPVERLSPACAGLHIFVASVPRAPLRSARGFILSPSATAKYFSNRATWVTQTLNH